MTMRVAGAGELRALAGSDLPATPWIEIDQPVVDAFARLTGDEQWIHVDVQRAKGGPFGGTIAHGFLTLSLLPRFWREAVTVDGFRAAVNYGSNRYAFPRRCWCLPGYVRTCAWKTFAMRGAHCFRPSAGCLPKCLPSSCNRPHQSAVANRRDRAKWPKNRRACISPQRGEGVRFPLALPMKLRVYAAFSFAAMDVYLDVYLMDDDNRRKLFAPTTITLDLTLYGYPLALVRGSTWQRLNLARASVDHVSVERWFPRGLFSVR
jgi:hypothetical protein